MNKSKLQAILKALTPDDTRVDFSTFDSEIQKLKDSLKEKITVKTVEDVQVQLSKFSKKINFEPLTQAFEQLKTDWATGNEELIATLNGKQTELTDLIKQTTETAGKGDESLKQEIEALTAEIAILSARKVEIPDFGKQIKGTESKLVAMIDTAKTLDSLKEEKEKESLQVQFANFEKQIKELKLAFQNRGGGSMNRQMFIGGVDPLTRYTDVNFKAGSNVTLTYANNDTTKKVDITISSSGGGGGGTVRSISSISTPTTAGATSGTDYVYLVTGATTLTLPTAVGNTNLYTVKNVGTGTVTIATTSAQTIDGSTTITLPVQYTAVDLISDTANWNVT